MQIRFSLPAAVLLSTLTPLNHVAAQTSSSQSQTSDAPAGQVDLPRFPSISPDGDFIVFSWRGDLWKVPASGGHAIRISSHPGTEERTAFSPDGQRLAFESDRNGYQNIYLMNVDGTGIDQLTHIDRPCSLAGFGTDADDESIITFSASMEGDNYRSVRPYQISLNGGDLERALDCFGDFPQVSPDGRYVTFERGGSSWTRRHYMGPDSRELWLYDRQNDAYRNLSNRPGNDGMARWLDESTIIFASDRNGSTVNLYRLDVTNANAKPAQITQFDNRDVKNFDIAPGARRAAITAWDALYTLDLADANAQPQRLTITASEDERDNYTLHSINRDVTEAALSPDGKVMAFVAYGEIFIRSIEDDSPTVRITDSHALDEGIAWSPDGVRLFFTSDRAGTEDIYAAHVTLTRSEVKEQFEKTLNPPAEPETDKADEEETEESEQENDVADESDADAEDEENAQGADDDADSDEDDKDKKKDKKDEKLPPEFDPERWHDAIAFEIRPVVVDDSRNDRDPQPSPDGKSLLFRGTRGDLMVLDFETNEQRPIHESWDSWIEAQWSPDSSMIAIATSDMDFNSDIWIVPADGSHKPVNVSQHPDNDESPRWSADGKILAFVSERVNEENDVWMVFLESDLEAMTDKELAKYFEEAGKAAKARKPIKPVGMKTNEEDEDATDSDDDDENDEQDEDASTDDEEVEESLFESLDLNDAFLRLRRVTSLPGNEGGIAIAPNGETIYFNGRDGDFALYSIKYDGSDIKRVSGSASVQGVTADGSKLVLVSGGQGSLQPASGGSSDTVSIDHTIRIDLQEQASQKFLHAARILGEWYYHPSMNNLDWPAVSQRYHQLARNTRTSSEFNDVAARFLGELNGSHLGIRSPGERAENVQSMGRLGTVHHRVQVPSLTEGNDAMVEGFKITHVIPQGPASIGPMALKVGDVITAINSEPFRPTDTIESRLEGHVGDEVLLTLRRTTDAGDVLELRTFLTPTSYGREVALKYDDWRSENARLVSEWSDGQVGYIHIRGMDQGSLDVFERDLYAACHDKKGLIIDVRNNGGGWTTDRLLASITYPQHAYTIPRGADQNDKWHYPQDRLFIQRYTLPINMLCNEKSYSNAEIISHAFKNIGRGTLVGQQTHGAVISTGGTSLIDGTTVRLPFRGWYLPDDRDMEHNGAMPDIVVEQTPAAEARNDDEQLKVALDDLLKRID